MERVNASMTNVSHSLGAAFAPMLQEIADKAAKASASFSNLVRKIVEGGVRRRDQESERGIFGLVEGPREHDQRADAAIFGNRRDAP
jgi:hypothetical protein